MCNTLKFTKNSLIALIPYLLIYSQQCFVTTLLRQIALMRNVFCFNGFNQKAIVLFFLPILNHVKRLKPLKQKRIQTDFDGMYGKWIVRNEF